jgi:hypothetical protein
VTSSRSVRRWRSARAPRPAKVLNPNVALNDERKPRRTRL